MIRTSVILFLLGTSSLFAQEVTRTLTAGFVYNQNGRFPFSVEATLVPFDKKFPKVRYFGADGGIPQFVCSSFAYSFNGRDIEIPKKAVVDLGDIKSVTAPSDNENDTWTISVTGGDAGGSYEVELIFDNKKLLERRFIDVFSSGRNRKYLKIQKY